MAGLSTYNDVESSCKWTEDDGTKFHHAALNGDMEEMFDMLENGKKVDVQRSDGKTALMLAVGRNFSQSVTALLECGANIDIVNENGQSALEMVFKLKDTHPVIIKSFLNKVRSKKGMNTKELVEKLLGAGCTLYHAAFLNDYSVIQGLLERGVCDVDSTYYNGRTALHIAAESSVQDLVGCILSKGANVNALDDNGRGPLCIAAANGNSRSVQWLLVGGADPNAKSFEYGLTPLISALENSDEENQGSFEECVELLLEYGAIPSQKTLLHDIFPTVFDKALNNKSFYRIDLVICNVALREMKGMSIAKTMMDCNLAENQYAISKMQKYYESCQKVLKTKMFESLTLFDLLSASEYKFRIYLRNKSFSVTDALFAHPEIYELHRYYHKTLLNRLWKAPDRFLEDEAVTVICKISDGEYNQCYIFAREIVSYLDKHDLRQLCKV